MPAFTHLLLKNELQNDPSSLGLTALFNAGNDAACARVLNFIRDGVASPPDTPTVHGAAINLFRDDVTRDELVDGIVNADFKVITQLQVNQMEVLFAGSPKIDATKANLRTNFASIFTGTTLANWTAIASRNASRAEQLWGLHFQVSPADVGIARSS